MRIKRHRKIRRTLSGTDVTPRLCVFRSNQAIYAQLIDDVKGVTIASSSSLELKLKNNNLEAAAAVGKDIAEKAKKLRSKQLYLIVVDIYITDALKLLLMQLVKMD